MSTPDAAPPVEVPMDGSQTAALWDKRHRELDRLRSGGHSGYDEAANEMLYAMRLGLLVDIVGHGSEQAAPLRVLDAGCGKGVFARAMARFGHRVDGIDVSEHAVDLCRDGAGPLERYEVCSLEQWHPPYLYDVVYCIDVLFHVMDDALWRACLENLATLVRPGGQLVVAEHGSDTDRTWSDYQRTRGLPRYEELLRPRGFLRRDFVPIPFRGGPVGYLVMRRTWGARDGRGETG